MRSFKIQVSPAYASLRRGKVVFADRADFEMAGVIDAPLSRKRAGFIGFRRKPLILPILASFCRFLPTKKDVMYHAHKEPKGVAH